MLGFFSSPWLAGRVRLTGLAAGWWAADSGVVGWWLVETVLTADCPGLRGTCSYAAPTVGQESLVPPSDADQGRCSGGREHLANGTVHGWPVTVPALCCGVVCFH